MNDYHVFIKGKHKAHTDVGFSCPSSVLPAGMKDWQADVTAWALAKGRAALFEDCGLGPKRDMLLPGFLASAGAVTGMGVRV